MSPPRRRVAICLGVLLAHATAHAQPAPDKVTLRLADGSHMSVPCHIVRYTGDEIVYRLSLSSNPKRQPASDVVRVATRQTSSHVKGLALFGSGRVAEAGKQFENAYVLEDREWVKRELLALLIRCSLWTGNREQAAVHFVELVKSDKKTSFFSHIPLAWEAPVLKATMKARAEVWLTQKDSEGARLLGASILLFDKTLQKDAADALNLLTTSSDKRVRALAQAQQWRKQLAAGTVAEFEITRWRKHIAAMPKEIRGGPHYLLGKALASRRLYSQAAAEFLWAPLAFDHDHAFSARAMLEAAEALKQAGKKRDAFILYREITRRFQSTESAMIAADILKRLTAPTP